MKRRTYKDEDDLPELEDVSYLELQHREAAGRRSIVWGVILIALAVVITAVTYDAASARGGTYVIALGPLIYGLIRIGRGLEMIRAAGRLRDSD
jgi:hypothetical protein